MLKSNSIQTKAIKLVAVTLSLTTIASSFSSVSAKPNKYRYNLANKPYAYPSKTQPNQYSSQPPALNYSRNTPRRNIPRRASQNSPTYYSTNLSAGTIIPATYPSAKKILVTKDETMPVTLEVTSDVRDRFGEIVIPRGSQVIGEIRPGSGGSRFVGDTLVLNNGDQFYLTANSQVVSRTEVINDGRNTDAIWQGALAGAGAATLIAGVTGDKAIATEEVLGGAGFGALAGFLFGGNHKAEVISIDTQKDLNLTLTSDLSL